MSSGYFFSNDSNRKTRRAGNSRLPFLPLFGLALSSFSQSSRLNAYVASQPSFHSTAGPVSSAEQPAADRVSSVAKSIEIAKGFTVSAALKERSESNQATQTYFCELAVSIAAPCLSTSRMRNA